MGDIEPWGRHSVPTGPADRCIMSGTVLADIPARRAASASAEEVRDDICQGGCSIDFFVVVVSGRLRCVRAAATSGK